MIYFVTLQASCMNNVRMF